MSPQAHETPVLEPAVLIIFGITGDLSQKKLLPALYHLIKNDLLHEHTVILGVTRRDVNTEDLLRQTEATISAAEGGSDPATVQKLGERLQMMQLDITDGQEYDKLLERLNAIEADQGMCMNRLYYLSIPPQVFGPIVRFLGQHGLNKSCPHDVAMTRLLVEKPFGYDLASARELIDDTAAYFSEEQIFRIDHYVAKETVQNILAFRFKNPIFSSIWGSRYIRHIKITAAEKIGIEGRSVFYEQTGALRDFIQSHLLQLMAITMMEQIDLGSQSIHAAKLALLEAVRPIPPDQVDEFAVRGQYEGYTDEVQNPGSSIETYAALLLRVNNDRWRNTPVLIRTGKALADKLTQIDVIFGPAWAPEQRNILTFRIQPDEGIALELRVKKPGFEDEVQQAEMDFSYQRRFEDAHGHPDAYERVLVDAVRGDHTLFATSDEVLASWKIVEPVLQAWSRSNEVPKYTPGSWGPDAADALLSSIDPSTEVNGGPGKI